ncbi:MAG: allophanate hydrolase [Puniceicoccaceae bacterium]|nr:allophanate hydrolase [Puniceicoccaceae bacterium]|tara:strand:+ start:423 stop:1094 length:672 start_codon:yes stop_codon:yes gene_type:complete
MDLKPYGDRGLLLAELSDAQRTACLNRLAQALPAGCEEYVVGYDSILLLGPSIACDQQFKASIRSFVAYPLVNAPEPDFPRSHFAHSRKHIFEVYYNGADLEWVAQACNLSIEQVIELHTAPVYTVRMMGFSPGFPYLEGLDPRLQLERRASPRNRIAPGAVAIGGSHAGIYTVASPGGWHLLGHTDFPLFDLEAARHAHANAQEVFALSPSDQVRFQPKEIR